MNKQVCVVWFKKYNPTLKDMKKKRENISHQPGPLLAMCKYSGSIEKLFYFYCTNLIEKKKVYYNVSRLTNKLIQLTQEDKNKCYKFITDREKTAFRREKS